MPSYNWTAPDHHFKLTFMIQLRQFFIGLAGLLVFQCSASWAQENLPHTSSVEELYQQGLIQYQKGLFAEAAEKFATAHARQPQNAQILFNWGLSEFQAGRKGLGLGIWRRALVVDPTLSQAREGLAYAEKLMQFDQTMGQGHLGWNEVIRQNVLNFLGLHEMLGACALLLLLSGWLGLRYLGQRKTALDQELPLPPFPTVALILFVSLLAASSLTVLKTWDLGTARGTVITQTTVRTAPTEESSSLFEAKEGSDVILRQTKNDWTQIRYPGGMSGWIPKASLFQTSGYSLW